MAERAHFSIPSGCIASHRLVWDDPQLGGGSAGGGKRGSLEWSVVVLDELTIDLEVSVQLKEPDGSPGLIFLQEVTRDKAFRGTFDPVTDTRLADQKAEVEAIVFDFNNAFSWWTGKEIELVMLRVRPPGPPLAMVPPLPSLQALPHIRRGCSGSGEAIANAGEQPPPAAADAAAVDAGSGLLALPDLQAPAAAAEAEGALAATFAADLDSWLGIVESRCPSSSEMPWLQELLSGVISLRQLCRQTGPDAQRGAEALCNGIHGASDEQPPRDEAPQAPGVGCEGAADAGADVAGVPAAGAACAGAVEGMSEPSADDDSVGAVDGMSEPSVDGGVHGGEDRARSSKEEVETANNDDEETQGSTRDGEECDRPEAAGGDGQAE